MESDIDIGRRDGGEWNESKKAFRVDDVPVECLKIPSTLTEQHDFSWTLNKEEYAISHVRKGQN